MTRNRLELLNMWHFNDNNDELYANDRLRKISPLIKKLNQQFKEVLTPGTNICIDETMVSFRGRLIFKRFIKHKPHKFSIKPYKLRTEKGYTYNIRVYSATDTSKTGSAWGGIRQSYCACFIRC